MKNEAKTQFFDTYDNAKKKELCKSKGGEKLYFHSGFASSIPELVDGHKKDKK